MGRARVILAAVAASLAVAASAHAGQRAPHDETFAPYLPSSAHFVGQSVRQRRLGAASYRLSKYFGTPTTVDVACWSVTDWDNISGDSKDSYYSTVGFFDDSMPHWIELSPDTCRALETLIYHRPRFANVITAEALDTLAHETVHALGVTNEAETECYAMQLTVYTGESLGIDASYARSLARLTFGSYDTLPPDYINRYRCRENGAWDLFPGPSPPWHG